MQAESTLKIPARVASAEARAGIEKCFSILNMDASPLRMQWAFTYPRSWRVTLRHRRAMLEKAGKHFCNQYSDWDALPEVVREAIKGAHE